MKYVNPRLFRDGLLDINYSTVGWILLGNPVVKDSNNNWTDYYKNNDDDPKNTRLKVVLDSELKSEDDMTSENTTEVAKYFFYDVNILGISCALKKITAENNNHKSFASIKHSINKIKDGSATKTYFKNEINIDIPFNGNEEEATKILPFYKYTEYIENDKHLFHWEEIPNENYPNNFGFDLKEPGGFLALVKYKENINLSEEDMTLNGKTYKGYKPETIMNYRFGEEGEEKKALSDIFTFNDNSISFDDNLIYTNNKKLSRRFYDYFIDDILAYYTVQNTDISCINKASYKGFATGKLVIPVTGEAS